MNIYTYGGIFFGKRDGDDLWTYSGKHVGRFRGNEVYDKSGKYIGELRDGRLITSKSKNNSTGGFSPKASRVGFVPSVDKVGTLVPNGYIDFPSPDEFE